MRYVFVCIAIGFVLCNAPVRASSNEIDELLDEYLDMSKDDELRVYHDNLSELLRSDLPAETRAKVERRLGDVCHDLGRLRASVAWYEKAQAVLPELKDPYKSFVPMRLKRLKNRIFRQNMLWGIYAVYALVVVALVYRVARSRGVDSGYLLKRGVPAVAGAFVVAGLVLVVDRAFLEPCGDGPKLLGDVTRPVLQFSFFDVMPGGVFWKALIFLPIPMVVAVLQCSVRRRLNRWALVLQVAVLSLAVWSHFILLCAYDEELNGLAVLAPGHIYFDGDIEAELGLRPAKVMEAAKEFPDACSVFEQYTDEPVDDVEADD